MRFLITGTAGFIGFHLARRLIADGHFVAGIADHPLNLYAASKKSAELMAHSYAHLWRTPTTAFRFFTVYGP